MAADGRLSGQVAVVTGGASGIGRALAKAFAAEGAHVLATDLNEDLLADLERAGIASLRTDVTQASDLDMMIDTAIDRWGRIDILCNNAGAPDAFHGAEECADAEWELGLALHLTAAFVACRRALIHMLPVKRGLILNTVSTAGITGANGGASYTASKHGLVGLTRSIAAMYCVDGIRAVAICPGAVDTGATELVKRRRASGELSERSERVRARTLEAFVRRAQPDEFGELATFLATGGAELLNGAVLTANSGYSAH
jgi:NAD(P)-dependent dehydrogenase (short-subunit alcohol dehydrogenase family)